MFDRANGLKSDGRFEDMERTARRARDMCGELVWSNGRSVADSQIAQALQGQGRHEESRELLLDVIAAAARINDQRRVDVLRHDLSACLTKLDQPHPDRNACLAIINIAIGTGNIGIGERYAAALITPQAGTTVEGLLETFDELLRVLGSSPL